MCAGPKIDIGARPERFPADGVHLLHIVDDLFSDDKIALRSIWPTIKNMTK